MRAIGVFILSVRTPGQTKFREISRHRFGDTNEKSAERDVVRKEVSAIAGRWRSNYAQFNDAEFRIEEDVVEGGRVVRVAA